jgi:hypothetical protein
MINIFVGFYGRRELIVMMLCIYMNVSHALLTHTHSRNNG